MHHLGQSISRLRQFDHVRSGDIGLQRRRHLRGLHSVRPSRRNEMLDEEPRQAGGQRIASVGVFRDEQREPRLGPDRHAGVEIDRRAIMAETPQAAEAAARQKQRDGRADPNEAMYARMMARQKQMDDLRRHLGDLEGQAAQAQADSGAATLADKAAQARAAFKQSLAGVAEAEQESKAKAKPLAGQVSAAGVSAGKIASAGSFSAAGAALSLGVNNKPNEETARNTAGMYRILRQQKQQRAAFA